MDESRRLIGQDLKHLSQERIDGLWNGGNVQIDNLMINETCEVHAGRDLGVEED